MRRIERLPEATHSSVRSGVVLCDLTTIVEELVLNGIDAGATEVSVAVGVGSCYVKVVDNGSGITRDGLVLLGERYATSKVDPMAVMDIGTESFDFHGEALCSISDVSFLEIVTKAPGKPNGYRKIMRNCKCLFLGISDDRQDVGTTVTVRDVFYNHPVRRKHMESSPKKVLDSIKMSVLRIALVHVHVSFKVVDVESTSELLHTGPSRSPLSILFSNFKIENPGALYRLNVSDGVLKISGYISGPCEIHSLKAIQYVYINSRFICKGPIHKLMNQLAAKFDLLNSSRPTTGSQREKRNRCQMCPTFILNLNCPRSYYDIITSERSRTSVEFKDWGPVLTCIENCIMRLWTENISHDRPVTFESGRKRCRKQNCQTSVDLCSPQLKKLSENYTNVHAREECVSYDGKPLTKVSELKKHQSEADFLSDTDYLSRSCDEYLSGYGVTKNEASIYHQSPCSVFTPEHYHFMAYSSDKQEDGISCPELGHFLPKFDDETNNISVRSEVSVDCLKFGDDIHINQDLTKSFLRNCSYQRSLLHDRTSPASDERFDFGSDDLGIKKKWVDSDDSIIDETDLVVYKRDIQCNGAPLFQASPMTQYDMPEGSEVLIRDLVKSSLSFRNILPDSSKQFWKCNSTQRSFSPGWSPVTAEQVVGIKFQEDDVNDVFWKNLVESHTEFDKVAIRGYPTRRKDEDLIGSYLNTEESWFQRNCSLMNSLPDHKGCTDYEEIGDFYWEDFEYSLSPNPLKRFSETDWSPLLSYRKESPKIYSVPSLYDTPIMEHECGRPGSRMQESMSNRRKSSIRSHSAPPFYKGKKRFLDLSYSSTMLSTRSNFHMICRSLFTTEPCNSNLSQLHAETRNFKYLQKSFGQYYSSPMERSIMDCSFATRSGLERTPEVVKIKNCRSQKKEQLINTESVECLDLKEIQDSLDSGQKWRDYSLLTAGDNIWRNNKDQDTILDISSDILHLTGDSLVPKSIDKTSLDDAKVLNQVDKKFIAVVAGRTLAVIDQHAADERIRLEELRQKVLSGEMKTITYLDGERELVLPEIGYQLLHNYAKQIQTWGWICNIHFQDTSFFTKNLDSLHRQPTVVKLLAVPCILGVNLTDMDLLEFLQQLADTDGSSTIPPSVHRVLNNKACRGAIMFGDALLPSECSLIVEELKRTSLCFQCAHGRPTTVPLVDLNVLHNKIARLGSHKSWHGLYQHELKIKRSAQRLSSALC